MEIVDASCVCVVFDCGRFRLRRHSNQKHPYVPIKWIDLVTGEVCFDPQKPPSSAADDESDVVDPTCTGTTAHGPVRKQTARKSTTGRLRMQVALFRSAKFGCGQRETGVVDRSADVDSDSDGDLKIVEDDEEDDENSKDAAAAVASDSEDESHCSAVYIDNDMDVSSVPTDTLRFCCHLCSFAVFARSPSALSDHLNRQHHSDMCRLPAVEILDFDVDTDDGTAPMLLRRCGFCSFESFVGGEFDEHVLSTHKLTRPLRCNRGCMYATFSRLQMHAHFAETHPRETFSVSPLDKPYSMLPYEEDSAEDNDDICVSFSAKAILEDVFELSDTSFEALLNAYGVWY